MIGALSTDTYMSGLSNSLFGLSSTALAEEIATRAGETLEMAAQTASPDNNVTPVDKTEQLNSLKESLASTLSWVESRYGAEAAQAVTGLMAAHLGEGAITEDSIGQSLLQAVRFVDGNFGFAEGDAFMEHLNGSLNDSLNALFDNGTAEMFYAVAKDGSVSGLPTWATNALDSQTAGETPDLELTSILKEMTDSIMEMLEEARAQDQNVAQGLNYGQTPTDQAGLLVDTLV